MIRVKKELQTAFIPPRPLKLHDEDHGDERITAYFEETYQGAVVIISGSVHLATLPSVKEALKLVSYTILGIQHCNKLELIPELGSDHITHQSFEEWLTSCSE